MAACRHQTVAHRSQRSIAVPTDALPRLHLVSLGTRRLNATCSLLPSSAPAEFAVPLSPSITQHGITESRCTQSGHDVSRLNQDTMCRGSIRTRYVEAQPGHYVPRLNQDTPCQGSTRTRCVKARAAMYLQCVSSVLFFHFINIEGNINIRTTCASTSPHGFITFGFSKHSEGSSLALLSPP